VAANFEDREDLISFNYRGPISAKFFNLFRFYTARQHTSTTSVHPEPKVIVLGAFTNGGAQADRLQTENHIALSETVVWSGATQTVRFGVNVPDISRRGLDDNTNTAGTYTFSSLQDYLQQRPFSLVRQSGNGHIVFVEKVLGGFVQDELKVRPNLQITAGLRYDWQNYFHDNHAFAPRASLAYSPGQSRTIVIRGGAGFFYDRTGPQPIFDLLRYDGNRLLQYVINNPPYPDPGATGPTSIVRLDPTVKLPYLIQYGTGIERQLRKSTTLSVNYYGTRGINLFRSRDVNAPPPPFYLARPDPQYSIWRQIESSADLKSNSLEMAVSGAITRYFSGMIQYTLAKAYNNTGGNSLAGARTSLNSFPANDYDLRGEWARADYDQRHRFNLLGSITPGRYFKLGVALALYSGMPYSMTTGNDDYNDGLANSRPPGVPRNSLHGPGYADLDVRWSHDFFLAPTRKDKGPVATFGLDAFDTLNHVNYASYVGVLSSPFFGKPVSALPTRRLQLSLRVRF
jgi:TonB dependent receptor